MWRLAVIRIGPRQDFETRFGMSDTESWESARVRSLARLAAQWELRPETEAEAEPETETETEPQTEAAPAAMAEAEAARIRIRTEPSCRSCFSFMTAVRAFPQKLFLLARKQTPDNLLHCQDTHRDPIGWDASPELPKSRLLPGRWDNIN